MHYSLGTNVNELYASRHDTTWHGMAWADVLGVMDGRGVADSGTIDDHKDAISALEDSAAATAAAAADATTVASASASHAHSHSHAGKILE